MAKPVVFSVLTTCVAFMPMLFVPGVAGKFFRVVPVVVIAVLLMSLVESLFVLPAHLSHTMPWWLRVILLPYLWLMERRAKLGMPRRLERHVRHFYAPFLAKVLHEDVETLETAARRLAYDISAYSGLGDIESGVPGLDYRLGRELERQADAMGSLLIGFLVAHIVMLSILAVAFRSYLQPLLVMSAIPFGMIGAVWGHALMGVDISLVSMMGLVALSGVVCNDSLILIDAINQNRDAGMTPTDALIKGGTRRFRPIVLTSLTTFLGLAPISVETSAQASFLVPMAVSLGFGILAATFIMLLIVPSCYVILEDLIAATENFFARLRERPTLIAPQICDLAREPAE